MAKRGRSKKVKAPEISRVEGGSPSLKLETVADQTPRTGRVTRAKLDSAASSLPSPFPSPPGFAPSDISPSLARYQTRHSLKAVLDRCNAGTAMLRSPIRNIKASYPYCATRDSPAHLTTAMTPATEENVDDALQAKLEHQSVPTIHGVFGVEMQNLGQQFETLPSSPAVENNTPPSNTDMVSNTNAARPETRSVQSGARPTKSGSVNITRLVALMNDNSSDDEVESRLDPLSVLINGYRVKEETAPVLQKIFQKYGDIAKQSSFTSVISSSLLELVCNIYKELEGKDLKKITTKELESMLAVVRDLETANLDVGWLHQRLNDIFEAKKLIQEYGILKEAEAKNLAMMETNKKALVELKDEWAACTATCRVLEERIREKQGELGGGNREKERIRQRYEDTKAKVKHFHHRSLVRDLL